MLLIASSELVMVFWQGTTTAGRSSRFSPVLATARASRSDAEAAGGLHLPFCQWGPTKFGGARKGFHFPCYIYQVYRAGFGQALNPSMRTEAEMKPYGQVALNSGQSGVLVVDS